jgi:hypothetical protein
LLVHPGERCWKRCCCHQGARRYMRGAGGGQEARSKITGAWESIDYAARHESALQHLRPGGLKRRGSVAQGALRTTKSISVNAKGASCTWSDGAAQVKPEGGRRARRRTRGREFLLQGRAHTLTQAHTPLRLGGGQQKQRPWRAWTRALNTIKTRVERRLRKPYQQRGGVIGPELRRLRRRALACCSYGACLY